MLSQSRVTCTGHLEGKADAVAEQSHMYRTPRREGRCRRRAESHADVPSTKLTGTRYARNTDSRAGDTVMNTGKPCLI